MHFEFEGRARTHNPALRRVPAKTRHFYCRVLATAVLGVIMLLGKCKQSMRAVTKAMYTTEYKNLRPENGIAVFVIPSAFIGIFECFVGLFDFFKMGCGHRFISNVLIYCMW